MQDKSKLKQIYLEMSTPKELVLDLIERAESGEFDGRTPTTEEIEALIIPRIPAPLEGKPGKTPSKSELREIILPLIPAPKHGKPGSPDTGIEIIQKIKEVKDEKNKLSIFDLKDLDWLRDWLGKGKGKDSVQWSSAGFKVYTDTTLTGDGSFNNPLHANQGGGGGFTELDTASTVNGSNASFVFTQVPSYIVADGVWFKKLDNNGNTQWSSSGTTVTMVNPPSESIWGVA